MDAVKVTIERSQEQVAEWKIRNSHRDTSVCKIVPHVSNGKKVVQVKFDKNLARSPDKDILKDNKTLSYHRVVANYIGPVTTRAIGEAMIEAADQMEGK